MNQFPMRTRTRTEVGLVPGSSGSTHLEQLQRSYGKPVVLRSGYSVEQPGKIIK